MLYRMTYAVHDGICFVSYSNSDEVYLVTQIALMFYNFFMIEDKFLKVKLSF